MQPIILDGTGRALFRRFVLRAGILLAAGVLLAGGISAAAPQQAHAWSTYKTYWSDGNTIGDILNMSREDYVSYLRSHMNDNYYLGTRFTHSSNDNRNPKGDCKKAKGASDSAGVAAMECTGFVWHTLYKASGWSYSKALRKIPAYVGNGFGAWQKFLRRYHIEHISVTGSNMSAAIDQVTELGKKGKLEEGDIIWCVGGSVGLNGSGLWTSAGPHHISIYIGKDKTYLKTKSKCKISTAGWNRWWHQSYKSSGLSGNVGNSICRLTPGSTSPTPFHFVIFKFAKTRSAKRQASTYTTDAGSSKAVFAKAAKRSTVNVAAKVTIDHKKRTVTSVDPKAFRGNRRVQSIKLPAKIKRLENKSFARCTKLKNVNLGKVKSVGTRAFQKCRKLTSVSIPASMKSVGKKAFAGSGVKSITLGTRKLSKKSLKNLLSSGKVKTVTLTCAKKYRNSIAKKIRALAPNVTVEGVKKAGSNAGSAGAAGTSAADSAQGQQSQADANTAESAGNSTT